MDARKKEILDVSLRIIDADARIEKILINIDSEISDVNKKIEEVKANDSVDEVDKFVSLRVYNARLVEDKRDKKDVLECKEELDESYSKIVIIAKEEGVSDDIVLSLSDILTELQANLNGLMRIPESERDKTVLLKIKHANVKIETYQAAIDAFSKLEIVSTSPSKN